MTDRVVQSDQPPTQLLIQGDEESFRARWHEVQTGFVDEPRRAVEQANQLVADVMQRLTDVFGTERAKLEDQWSRQSEVSTEDLRVVFQRYRAFFDRLLGM